MDFVNGFRMTSHILIMENKSHVPNHQADGVLRVLTCLNPTKLGGFDDSVQNWSLTPHKSQFNSAFAMRTCGLAFHTQKWLKHGT